MVNRFATLNILLFLTISLEARAKLLRSESDIEDCMITDLGKTPATSGHWETNGSPHLNINDDHSISCKGTSGSIGDYAIWRGGMEVYSYLPQCEIGLRSIRSHYWEFDVHSSSANISVGLTTEAMIEGSQSSQVNSQNSNIEGFFYNGDLHGWNKTVRKSFGPKPRSGDLIGVELSYDDNDFASINLYLNGTLMGNAFKVLSSVVERVYPVINFNGEGVASVTKKEQPPKEEEADHLTGVWKSTAGAIRNRFSSLVCLITRERSDSRLSSGASNPPEFHLFLTNPDLSLTADYSVESNGVWKMKYVKMDSKLPASEMKLFHQSITILRNLSKVNLEKGNKLKMSGAVYGNYPDGSPMFARASLYFQRPDLTNLN